MKTVAVIGASSDRGKFGNKALRAFRDKGHRVIPINPNEAEVEGLRTFPSVLDVEHTIDMATFYVRPEVGIRVIEEVAKKGITEVWLNPGSDGPAVIARARALGLAPVLACSIIAIGQSPYRY
jgi:uncharacterized protein